MVRLAVQHFVYDFCLGMVLDRLTDNFGAVDTTIPKKGDFYKRVSHVEGDEHYYNCLVKDVEVRYGTDDVEFYIVYLKYDYAKGSDYEDWKFHVDELENQGIDTGIITEEMEEVFFDENDYEDEITEDVEFLEFADCIGVNTEFYIFTP